MTSDDDQRVIPLSEERLHIAKAEVVTERLRVTTGTASRDVVVEEALARGALRVERVAVERAVTEAPPPRDDGETLIVSVVEERLVVEKRLFVVEEVRITRTTSSERVSIAETLRTMHATIERVDTTTGRD